MCTGNSASQDLGIQTIKVHPRVYGELMDTKHRSEIHLGSSPCVRGTRIIKRLHNDGYRFIPVCTGNSIDPAKPTQLIEVHPRVYGELVVAV